jgi:hypothetical protein
VSSARSSLLAKVLTGYVLKRVCLLHHNRAARDGYISLGSCEIELSDGRSEKTKIKKGEKVMKPGVNCRDFKTIWGKWGAM